MRRCFALVLVFGSSRTTRSGYIATTTRGSTTPVRLTATFTCSTVGTILTSDISTARTAAPCAAGGSNNRTNGVRNFLLLYLIALPFLRDWFAGAFRRYLCCCVSGDAAVIQLSIRPWHSRQSVEYP